MKTNNFIFLVIALLFSNFNTGCSQKYGIKEIEQSSQKINPIESIKNYSKRNNKIYYYDKYIPSDVEIKDADPKTFHALNSFYGKDQYHVYSGHIPIENADPLTFQLLKNDYAKDKNHIYNLYVPIENADPLTFTLLNNRYSKDKHHVYFGTIPVETVDLKNFQVLNDNYAKDLQHIYHGNYWIDNADLKTFRILRNDYAKDCHHVYFKNHFIFVADPITFKVLSNGYAKDNKHIYYWSNLIENADLTTFQVLNKGYAKDNYHVYHWESLVKNADPKTFQVLNKLYAKDRLHVYAGNNLIEHADPLTFKVLKDGYSKDKRHVFGYNGSEPLKMADSKTFQVLDGYAKDKQHVYIDNNLLVGADPRSFQRIDNAYTKDRHHVYIDNNLLEGADPETFQILNDFYAKDNRHVFFSGANNRGMTVFGADPLTFQILEDAYAKDKDHVFWGQILEGVNPKTLKKINTFIYGDDENIAWGPHLVLKKMPNKKTLVPFDVKTFEYISDSSNDNKSNRSFTGLVKDYTGVYRLLSEWNRGTAHHTPFCSKVDGSFKTPIATAILLNYVDPNTFKIEKDSNGVLRISDKDFLYDSIDKMRILKTTDSEKIKELGCHYIEYKNNIYYNHPTVKKLNEIHSNTFQILVKSTECEWQIAYAKDEISVFYGGEKIPQADAKTFNYMANGLAFDKNRKYSNGEHLSKENESAFNAAYLQWKADRKL